MISRFAGGLLLVLLLLPGTEPGRAQSARNSFPWFEKAAKPAVYPRILVGASWLARNRSPGLVVVDVREASEYTRGHVPGALRFELPPRPAGSAAVRAWLGLLGLSGLEEVVLYGDPASLGDLGRAFLTLESAGCSRVRVLDGGFDSWRAGGYPVELETGKLPPRAFEAARGEPAVIDLPGLQERFGEPGFEVLDVRGGWGEAYEAPPLFRAGHVPHSLPFDVRALLPGDGRLPRPAVARAALGRLGPRPDTPVNLEALFVVYGRDAADADLGLAYLLLRLAGLQVRVFPGGWEEWAQSPASPSVQILTTAELQPWLTAEPLLLFDLREEWDFRSGHLPGALPLPSHRFAAALEPLLSERWPGIDRSRVPVLFYCYGRECIRSRECSTLAAKHGFQRLFWYRDGVEAWQKDGRSLVREPVGSQAGDVYQVLEDASGPRKPEP